MSMFFRYDATGRIQATGQCPADHLSYYTFEGETLVEGMANAHTQWYDTENEELAEREAPAIQLDGMSISGIPVPCELRITGPVALSTTLDAPELNLSFDVPGTYTLAFEPEHPRWMDKVITLEVAE
jgi:hypothetical protein